MDDEEACHVFLQIVDGLTLGCNREPGDGTG